MDNKIAILGCGPSGLLSAHAAMLRGYHPEVFSIKRPSLMPGAIYCHEQIPQLLPVKSDVINYAKLGSKEGYARKVYGSYNAPTSWDKFREGGHTGWSMKELYEQLWDKFERQIFDVQLHQGIIEQILMRYDIVVNTVPLPAICCKPGEHVFHSKSIWVRREHRDVCEQLGDPCIIYNGDPHFAYYRTSLIFGGGSTEFAHEVHNAEHGRKPLDNDCDCWPEMVRAGRYGRWERGVLVNDAFRQVLAVI